MNNSIVENVNKLCVLKTQADYIKKQISELEAFFLKQAEKDLKDTKIKTVTYRGDSGMSVSATMAATVKMEHPTLLKEAFGKEVYAELVKERPVYDFSSTAKRVLAGLFLRNYTKETLKSVLRQTGADDKTLKALEKKVKGKNFKKDTEFLKSIAGLDTQEAQYFAYFASEALVWDEFIRLMKAKGDYTQADIEKCLKIIDSAIIVEETPKITVNVSDSED